MARSVLPDALTRREWLEASLDASRALEVAEAYLAADRVVEAVAFLARASARERLSALRDEAIRSGDAFLVREVCRALDEEPSPEEWQALEEAAAAGGKEFYAAEARRHADRTGGE